MGGPDPDNSHSEVVPDSPVPASQNQSPQANPAQPAGTSDRKKRIHWGKCINLWVDTLSKLAVIFAALIGGLWGWKAYREITAPTLEKKTKIASHLEWPDKLQTHDTCWAEYDVSLKNDGTTPFNIDSHVVTVWLVDRKRIPAPTTEPTLFIPVLTDDEIVYDKTTVPISGDIHGHYPPGSESSSSSEFIFKKPTKGTFVVVMRIDVHGHTNSAFGKNEPVDDHSWAYDKMCP